MAGAGFSGWRRLVGVEAGFEIADAERVPVEVGVPVEGGVADGEVLAVGAVDGLKDGGAVFDGAADGAEFIHGPAEGHGAGAGNETEGGAEAGDAAARGGRGDGAEGFRAYRECYAAGGGGGGGSGGGAAGALFGIPGIAGASAEPDVAHGEGAEGELGDEHGAGRVEALDDGGVFIDGLMLEAAGSPGGGVALDGEQIFGAPGESVKRAAVFALCYVGVGFAGVGESAIFGEGDVEVEDGIVALESREVHLREVDGGDFAAADEVGEVHRGLEGEVFEVRGRVEGGGSFGVDRLVALGIDGGAGRQGIEDEGGGDGVGEVELTDGDVAAALFVEVVEHGGFVVGGDGDGGERGGLVDHLGSDFGELGFGGFLVGVLGVRVGGGLGGECIEDAGEEGGGEAEAAGRGEEVAAIHGRQVTGYRLQVAEKQLVEGRVEVQVGVQVGGRVEGRVGAASATAAAWCAGIGGG